MERLEVGDSDYEWEVHRYRYSVAARFVRAGDVVLDAACGIGYGRHTLPEGITWIGVDRRPPEGAREVDLRTWVADLDYDVFIGLETIEHIDGSLDPYVGNAKRAKRAIVISTPIIPTIHFNEFHKRDFTPASLEALFVDDVWRVAHYETQVNNVYGIWAFTRREAS
jgi:hypothetical protein